VREEPKIKLCETPQVYKTDSKMSNIKIGFEKIYCLFAGQQAEILKSASQNPISFQN
jgi:hypothetical protein